VKALIVDDEAPARAKLVRLLREDGRFELAGEAADGHAAIARILETQPDLVLLDVQLPGLTGFEVLRALGDYPKIIFSTAHDHFALAAFDAHAVDYLLKPYDEPRFRAALDKVVARPVQAAQLAALVARYPGMRSPYLERLLVRRGPDWIPIALDGVRRLAAEDKHVRIYAAGGGHVIRDSLGELESRLDPAAFVRVHRGEIVQLRAVARLEALAHGDAVITLDDDSSVVLSRTYRDAFFARWGG
jgi:two-component system, LytTR family, response regulator